MTALAQTVHTLTNGEIQERGRSTNFDPAWTDLLIHVLHGFGTPTSVFDEAIYAYPLSARQVAVVQVHSAHGVVSFRSIIIPRDAYVRRGGDPFLVSDAFPPDWNAFGDLAALEWPDTPSPYRTIAELQQVLQTGGSGTLLGSIQALIDGGHIVYERSTPAPQLLRDLWKLLPESTRGELWPATFSFANSLRFDVLVTPKADTVSIDRYLSEEQAVDYPHGRYEFSLQYAIEHEDQREVDRLFARRSSKQMLRLALYILVGGVVAYLAMNMAAQWW